MKKFITFVALLGLIATANAQSTETAPAKEQAATIEKGRSCAGMSDAHGGKACCAGKSDVKAEASAEAGNAAMPEGKGAACCAGKAGAAKSCHGNDTKAEAAATDTTVPAAEGKAAGCCAGKASAAKSCHGDASKAHAHEAPKSEEGTENK